MKRTRKIGVPKGYVHNWSHRSKASGARSAHDRGVPIGYAHNWTYRGRWTEKKIGPKKWKIEFRATKNKRSGKGGPPIGFRITWGFKNVRQRAVKTRNGQYKTILTGIKYPIKTYRPKKRYKR